MPIDLYSFHMSPMCRAVMMTAKELNIALNVKNIELCEAEQMQPAYLKMNPAHTVPTIDDNGFVLWESRAIMQYLCNQYAPDSTLYPKDSLKRQLVDRWLNFDMTLSGQRSVLFTKIMYGFDPSEDKVKSLKDNLKLLDQLIGDNKYLTNNELTIADLSLLTTISQFFLMDYDLTDYPNIKRWYLTLSSQLAYFADIVNLDKEVMFKHIDKVKARLAQQKQKKFLFE